MARKRKEVAEEAQRQTRKDILIARKRAQQTRQIRIGVAVVATLLALVFLFAAVNEFIIAPGRPVAIVNDEEITLREWQERVRFERAQRIVLLENQLEAFGGDVGIVQQIAGQAIVELQDAEGLGQTVLNQMVDEVVIRQAAEERGITVTEEDVDEEITAAFNYFGGESPTPVPTLTATIMPTPSLTPIPTAVITEEVATMTPVPTLTPGPTSTPLPTPTPVSEEAFEESFNDFMDQFRELGIGEETYRDVVRAQLYRERLMEALAEERDLAEEAEQASAFVLSFDTEEEAVEAAEQIEEERFLTVWNTIRSMPPDPESELTATASEVLWRTEEAIATSLGEEVADAIFSLPVDTPSEVLEQTQTDGTVRYHIVQVSGREVRPLSEAELENRKRELLASFIDEQLAGNLMLTEFDRGRAPTQPVLDPIFTSPPTATPPLPTPQPTIEIEPGDEDSNQ
ncbi:MAG TPA: SurA N-terminal domain-containing protein [Anaerolineae bacterium]